MPTITHTGPLPAVLGLSLGPDGAGPHGLFAPDGALVALAEPTGQGWWWLTVGRDRAAAMARLTPPQAVLVGLDGEEVARCDLGRGPGGGPVVLRQGERRWEVATSPLSSGDRWRARVWEDGGTVLRLERAGDVVVVRPDIRLDPTLAVFATLALVRRSLPIGAAPSHGSAQLPATALDLMGGLPDLFG